MAIRYLLDAQGNQMTTDADELLFVDQNGSVAGPTFRYVAFAMSVLLAIVVMTVP
jgi:hypothetical protein